MFLVLLFLKLFSIIKIKLILTQARIYLKPETANRYLQKMKFVIDIVA